MTTSPTVEELYGIIKVFNESVWEDRASRPTVDQWLRNFTGECKSEETERVHALHLLSKFLYFGQTEVRELLRAMFQDLVRQQLSVKVRATLEDPNDFNAIHVGFLEEIKKTRFLGLGNPAESGTHILYDFRLVNGLPLRNFLNPHELFSSGLDDPQTSWSNRNISRLIFIDDFCGTGNQAIDIGSKYVPFMREVAGQVGLALEVWYITMIATTTGIEAIKDRCVFDQVETVAELDETYRTFDLNSQIYADPSDSLNQCEAEAIVSHYGNRVQPSYPLGYGDSQLLIGFHHNVPNNTLPIIWRQRPNVPWEPIFPRYTKFN